MAHILVRNLDPKTKERLRKRAALNGRSMEAEARLILKLSLAKPIIPQEEGLGTQIVKMFDGVGMDFEIPKYSDEDWGLFEFPEDESEGESNIRSENPSIRDSA